MFIIYSRHIRIYSHIIIHVMQYIDNNNRVQVMKVCLKSHVLLIRMHNHNAELVSATCGKGSIAGKQCVKDNHTICHI